MKVKDLLGKLEGNTKLSFYMNGIPYATCESTHLLVKDIDECEIENWWLYKVDGAICISIKKPQREGTL